MAGAAPVAEADGWIGGAPTRVQTAAILFVGCVGVLVAGLQPVMLGALQAAGRISAAQIGHAATLELLTLGLGAGLGAALEGRPLRVLLAATAGLYVIANLTALGARGEWVSLMRGLAGLPGGVMIWVATGLVVRSPNPARWSGLYLAIQTLAQLAVAAALGVWASGRPEAAPWVMAGLGALAIAAAFLVPSRFAPLPREPKGSGLPPPRGWVVLGVGVLLMACIVGSWVYLDPLGREWGATASAVALATPLSLACQVLGAACATVAAPRLAWFPTLTVAGALLALTTLALSVLPGPAGFLPLQALFGFLWLFVLPFGAPLAIEADPTRRTALLVPAANLAGAALGPLAGSLLVGDDDARAALRLCAGFAAAGVGLVCALRLSRPRASYVA